jgi:glycolate oxidase iron-sulfur subunit
MIQNFISEEKSLACVHCGLCLSACPTYLETGNENDSPRGRIYLMRNIQTQRVTVDNTVMRHIDLCLGCRACENACPSGVEYGHLLEHARDYFEKTHNRSFSQTFLRRIAIEQVFPFPWRLKFVLFFSTILRLPIFRWALPQFAKESLLLLPKEAISKSPPEYSPSLEKNVGRVGFIEGCVMQVMFGATHDNSIALLNQQGWDVASPKKQGCCGALYAHSGQLDKARECARNNIAAFEREKLDAIIINAAGCGSTLKEYGQLLGNDPAWSERAARFSAKVKDLSEWITPENLKPSNREIIVTYQDACHLAHPQGVTAEPRELVKAVAGDNYIELQEADVCCGSAGSYNLTEPEMAKKLQNRKVRNLIDTGAEIVVTANPGCLLQIQSGLKKAGSGMKIMHLADYLIEYGE